MADIYVDLDLSTGSNNGTSWANAYQTLEAALISNGGSTNILWIKGRTNTELSGSRTIQGRTSINALPNIIIGVKDATTNEPPTSSDLIPGFLTGDASAAHAQTAGNAAPIVQAAASGELFFNGHLWVYGVHFKVDKRLLWVNTMSHTIFHECHFEWDGANAGNDLTFAWSDQHYNRLFDCKFNNGTSTAGNFTSTSRSDALVEVYNPTFDMTWGTNASVSEGGTNATGSVFWYGADFSFDTDIADLVDAFDQSGARHGLWCKANGALAGADGAHKHGVGSGPAITPGAFVSIHSGADPGTPLGSGESEQTLSYYTGQAVFEIETTAVRTGGATDGASGTWALSVTPHGSAYTDPFYRAAQSPWIKKWVEGDGTNKTLTLYIANSGASDLDDDEVWIEVLHAPSDGNALADRVKTSRPNLLATPSAVTDDTTSTWGTGAANPQKITLTINPGYSGWVYVRVQYAPGTTDVLYVDPAFEVA